MLAPTDVALRQAGIVAVTAALFATLSDLTLLWVSYAGSGTLDVPAPPSDVTLAATYVGAVAILFYAVGYWQVACGLAGAGDRLARGVFLLGAGMAGVGAVIHGMTGLTIRFEALSGVYMAPAQAIVALLPLWLLGLACGGLATACYATAILRHATAYPRWMAAANPMVLPVVVAGVAALCGPRVRAFVVPAAPNIAHVIFFGLTTATLRRRG